MKASALGLSILLALQTGAQTPSLTPAQWREDLAYLARELPRRHKNLYHTVSKQTLDQRIADLDAEIPKLAPHEIVVRMRQLTALVGDGHTGLSLPPWFTVYPVAMVWFGRELRVTAGSPEYRNALGAKVIGIGNLTLDQAMARINTTHPSAAHENEWFVMATSPAMIRPEILHALGIIPSVTGPAAFKLEDDQGKQFTVDVVPVPAPQVVNGVFGFTGFVTVAAQQPLFRQQPGRQFWFTLLPDSQTVYVNWRSYRGLGDQARQLFALVDSVKPRRLVIDLRQNGGGDFFEGRRHMVEPVKKRLEVNQKDRLFVLVGRRTYSAAMVNAIDFRKETNATLVGEPIGERPNSYSENDELTLPNSRVVVSYSTRYYKFLDQDVPTVLPDMRIDPDWASFRAGRDPVLEWVESRPRGR